MISSSSSSSVILLSLAMSTALFVQNLDATIILTSLPQISDSLGCSISSLKLAVVAYLVAAAALMPLGGWITSWLGSGRTFQGAMLVFAFGSICCGFSSNVGELTISRVIQGLGGALMAPVARVIIFEVIPKEKVIEALFWVSIPAQVGPLLGPPLGGIISEFFSWRYIFFVNIPMCAIGVSMTNAYCLKLQLSNKPRLDWIGWIIVALSLSSATFGVSSIGSGLISNSISLILIVFAILCFLVYMHHFYHTENAIIDLDATRWPLFRACLPGDIFFRLYVGGFTFLLPLLLQLQLKFSPRGSGLILGISAIGQLLMRQFAKPLLKIFGFGNMCSITMVLLATNALIYNFVGNSILSLSALIFFAGFFRSSIYVAITSLMLSEIPRASLIATTNYLNVIEQFSFVLGISVVALLLDASSSSELTHSFDPVRFGLPFCIVALTGYLSALCFLRIPKTSGNDLIEKS